jgi:hypothetical protein
MYLSTTSKTLLASTARAVTKSIFNMIHFIETKKLGTDHHVVLWQRGEAHYEIEVIDFRATNPYEHDIVAHQYRNTTFEEAKRIFAEEY